MCLAPPPGCMGRVAFCNDISDISFNFLSLVFQVMLFFIVSFLGASRRVGWGGPGEFDPNVAFKHES